MSTKRPKTQNNSWNIWKKHTIYINKWIRWTLYIDVAKELEYVLWHELGSQEDYSQTTSINNLAVFIRSLIGLNQDAVNERFGEFITGNKFNSQQQEFVLTIINYVRENGDIELSDMVNSEPFNNYDLNEMFGVSLSDVVSIG